MSARTARRSKLRGIADAHPTKNDAETRSGGLLVAFGLLDERAETRSSVECARCHTTWGFLDAVEGKRHGERMPPDDEPPMGISCSACHAAHAENVSQPGLLRRVTLSSSYSNIAESVLERSSTCIYCHTPAPTGGPSSALIWAGQGAVDPVSGALLLGPAPHAAVAGGCVGCHGGKQSMRLAMVTPFDWT